MISKTIEGFDRHKAFLDKSVDEKISILTKAILNIMSNFIPNEIVTTDDRDRPWINNNIKSLIKNKTEFFGKANNPVSIRHFEQVQETLQKTLKFLSKSIIPNFLENLQLTKSIPSVTGPY